MSRVALTGIAAPPGALADRARVHRAAGSALRGWLAYLVALAIGAALAATTFPAAVIFPRDAAAPQLADTMQHIIGQRYFIADAWRWPVLVVPSLGWPDGTNIALTDSIPALALLAKLARSILPPGFHTILLWLALAYVLQPVAAVYALRSTGERRLLPSITVAAIAASMPALLWRYGHAALSGHFVILLALGLYLRICHGARTTIWLATTALLLFSLLVHPYLLVMAAAVLAAAPLSLLLRRDRRWRAAAAGIGAGLLLTGVTAITLGYGGNQSPGGFGLYAMNLLSPVYPGSSALLPFFGMTLDGVIGQFEGYNYLGLGVLLLACIAVGVLARSASAVRLIGGHGGLLLACLVLTLLALSNHIYVGRHQIGNLGRVPDWLQQFRASGRFFWPVAYVIMIASVAAVARMRRALLAAGLLLVAAGLQVADASVLRGRVRTAMHNAQPWRIDHAALRSLLGAHRSLSLVPRFDCDADMVEPSFLQVLLVASETAIPVNTMYVARFNPASLARAAACADDAIAPLRDGELRVFVPAKQAVAVEIADSARVCRKLGELAVCSLNLPQLAGLAPLSPLPAIVPNTRVSPAAEGSDMLLGWSAVEPTGTWTYDRVATIAVRLDGRLDAPSALTVWGFGIAPEPGGNQQVRVSVNGRPIATWSVREFQPAEYRAAIPPEVDLTGPIHIRFEIASPVRPIDRNINSDSRRLGFFVSGFRIGTAE